MIQPNIERNNLILQMRDEEGRTFTWIAKQPKINIAEKNVRKIYHREKAKQSIKQKEAKS
jgi:hypothetical protein